MSGERRRVRPLIVTCAIGAILIAIAALLIVGVRPGKRDGAANDVELTMIVSGDPRAQASFGELIPAFEKANPGIKVRKFDVPYTGLYVKIQIMVAAGAAPDIVPMMTMRLPMFLERNAFIALDPYMAADADYQARKDDIYPKTLEGFRKDGRVYGMAWAQNLYGLYYNKSMFDAYNRTAPAADKIDYPSAKWDLAHYMDACRKLTRDTDGDGKIDQWGTINQGTYLYIICPILRRFGGDLLTSDKTRCVLDSPESIAAMKWFFDQPLVDHVAPVTFGPDSRSGGAIAGGPEEAFMAGKIALFEAESEYRFQFSETIKNFEWDVAEPPHGVAQTSGYECFGQAITRDSKHPREAWKFISFLVSPQGQRIIAQHNIGVPVLKSMCTSPQYFLNPANLPKSKEVYLKTLEYGQDIPSLKNFQEVEAAIDGQLDLARIGKISAEQACKNATKEANRLLTENLED